jgi:hypothetical protein
LKEETQIQTAKDYETAAVDVLALSFDMRITIIRDTKREKKIDFFYIIVYKGRDPQSSMMGF